MRCKRLLSLTLSAAMLFGSAAMLPESTFIEFTGINASAAESGLYDNNKIQPRTQQQIINYLNSHPFYNDLIGNYLSDTYSVTPQYSGGNFKAGSLSNDSLKYGLNALNSARYIAGLDEVALNSSYNGSAQAAALCDAAIGQLTHSPTQAAGMPDDLYQKGKDGASSSNLGSGYSSIAEAVMLGWLEDADNYNINRVGHRRWCLYPSMGETGFGHAGSYTAMYAFDRSSGDWYGTGYNVAWPAENMPIEFFNSRWNSPVWSFSNPNGFSNSATVKLTRLSDNKVWNFSSSSSDGDFYINNDYYAQPGCIIFRPKGISKYNAGDKFKVSITDKGSTISYNVNFFSLPGNTGVIPGTHTHSFGEPTWKWTGTSKAVVNMTCSTCGATKSYNAKITSAVTKPTCTKNGKTVYTATAEINGRKYTDSKTVTQEMLGHSYTATVVKPTCTVKGYTEHICSRCGNSYKDKYTDAKGHDWTDWEVKETPTCTKEGKQQRYCTRCNVKQTQTLKCIDHSYVKEKTVSPTCTEKGYTLYKCSMCGVTKKSGLKDALGHKWGAVTYTWSKDNSTCTATRVCQNDKTHKQTETVKTTYKLLKANCTANGTGRYTAAFKNTTFGTKTKDVTLKAAGSHSYSAWKTTKSATCTADGTQTRTCSRCGKTDTKTIAKLGHKFSAWTTSSFNVDKGTSTQTRKCSRCGKIESKTVNNAVTRFAGANRYDTAAKLSKSSYNTADTVIIADAMTFQDALIAVPLASAYNAPLLLANPNTITTQTKAELERLKAKKVIIVSTNNALKKPTLDALKKYNPTIISGKNCFETSKKVAEALQAKIKTNTKGKTKAPTDVFFTTNKAFADALSVSPVAALKGAPILYVDPSKKTLDSNITAYLNKVKGSVKNVYIVGGLNAIPKALENSIKSALPKKNYKRFDGATRYETCVMINQYFAGVLSNKTVCVAKGLDFPDALAGGFFAAKQKAPLILADNALKDAQKNYLKKKAIDKLYIFGGTVAVPDKLAKEIAKASV